MAGLDSFTLVILAGAVVMFGVFVAMYLMDRAAKKRRQPKT